MFCANTTQDHDDLYPTLGITQAVSGRNMVWTKTGEEERRSRGGGVGEEENAEGEEEKGRTKFNDS